MTDVHVAATATPEVAVVVVTHGARDWVQRCLAALVDHTDPVYELVVVDNDSPDGTAAWVAGHVHGATTALLGENLGFGPACDLGAAMSRAPLVCFLNSDALVEPDWWPPIRDRFAASAGVGAVASRLLERDGTVQEAGSVLFEGFETQPLGRGLVPDDLRTRAAVCVEYASAACLTVRRRALASVGGFDAALAPAYYEDVDLCLSLADAGWRVVVEPRSLVVHARGASSQPRRALALMQANRVRAAARWGDRVGPRPPLHGVERQPHRWAHARHASAPCRVLVASDDPTGTGATLATAFLRARPGAHVTLLALGDGRPVPDGLLDAGVEVAVDPADRDAWLAGRRFVDDVAVLDGRAAWSWLAADLATIAPQALLAVHGDVPAEATAHAVRLGDPLDPSVAALLAAAGSAPGAV